MLGVKRDDRSSCRNDVPPVPGAREFWRMGADEDVLEGVDVVAGRWEL